MVVLQALAGAAAAELAPELKDWSKDGIAFFNNIRTPAALLAASALKDAFVLQGKELPPSTLARTKRLWVFVREAYLMLMVVSFGLNLWTVFLSTAGAFHLQAGAFDPLASSMVALLGREFEYEWVAVRCQFILGMLMLVAAQARAALLSSASPLRLVMRPSASAPHAIIAWNTAFRDASCRRRGSRPCTIDWKGINA